MWRKERKNMGEGTHKRRGGRKVGNEKGKNRLDELGNDGDKEGREREWMKENMRG